ncbi:TPA: DUF1310 family protein [Streptococcus mutans]|uniref:DUF1310 family protein n=1 Tax=Streptococcus mutans TaxID=1309 RepID=UPI0002B5F726|nr:DUF1310 family protein [Streptococcus mutans]EMC18412.1 hypothetical protein SMU80_10118 [Streptococcus mutans SF1]EMC41301.1 hypothetical protein SMU97_09404 [Streptococcus mutans SM4]MDT9507599.1 DUF1310 domain-containing protein [Streptococcus mutans]
MKKNIWKMLLPITLVCLISGGIFYMVHQHQVKKEQEHQKMVKIATSKEAKKVYEEFIKHEDPDAFTSNGFVKTYKVDTSSLKYNPMGGLMVTVIVNDKQNLKINFNLIDNEDGTYSSAYYGMSSRLGEQLRN